jgi:hypothetical protein
MTHLLLVVIFDNKSARSLSYSSRLPVSSTIKWHEYILHLKSCVVIADHLVE